MAIETEGWFAIMVTLIGVLALAAAIFASKVNRDQAKPKDAEKKKYVRRSVRPQNI